MLQSEIQHNLNQNMLLFFQENAFKHVACKMMAILFRQKCVIQIILQLSPNGHLQTS